MSSPLVDMPIIELSTFFEGEHFWYFRIVHIRMKYLFFAITATVLENKDQEQNAAATGRFYKEALKFIFCK